MNKNEGDPIAQLKRQDAFCIELWNESDDEIEEEVGRMLDNLIRYNEKQEIEKEKQMSQYKYNLKK